MQVKLKANVANANTKKKKLVSCDWKDCIKTHETKPKYPDNGVLTRSSGFAKDWVAANLEPWKKYGAGIDSKATLTDYRKDAPRAKYAITAAALKHPEYHTQKHHLISINLFKNVSKLKKDAKLAGYDVNHKNNGVCLPTFEADIVRHDLQAHRGSHPNNLYNSKVQPLLKDLQTIAAKYCEADVAGDAENQIGVIKDLDKISRSVEGKIKSWKWLLRTEALAERVNSRTRLAALNKPNKSK